MTSQRGSISSRKRADVWGHLAHLPGSRIRSNIGQHAPSISRAGGEGRGEDEKGTRDQDEETAGRGSKGRTLWSHSSSAHNISGTHATISRFVNSRTGSRAKAMLDAGLLGIPHAIYNHHIHRPKQRYSNNRSKGLHHPASCSKPHVRPHASAPMASKEG